MTSCQMCSRWETEADLRILELEHSCLTLNRDQYFKGYSLLFTKNHVTELFQLSSDVRAGLMEEVSLVAKALHAVYSPNKINYELLGNMVPHIHWHIIPRFSSDKIWPKPIWAELHEEHHLTQEEYQIEIDKIRGAIA